MPGLSREQHDCLPGFFLLIVVVVQESVMLQMDTEAVKTWSAVSVSRCARNRYGQTLQDIAVPQQEAEGEN